jgi:hypothetical protein
VSTFHSTFIEDYVWWADNFGLPKMAMEEKNGIYNIIIMAWIG